MKSFENKVSYSLTFELHPEYEGDEREFQRRLADSLARHLEKRNDLVFVDSEQVGDLTPLVQVNLLVAAPEPARAALQAGVQRGQPNRRLQGAHVLSAQRAATVSHPSGWLNVTG